LLRLGLPRTLPLRLEQFDPLLARLTLGTLLQRTLPPLLSARIGALGRRRAALRRRAGISLLVRSIRRAGAVMQPP
jgi:hypothetical protein